MKNKENYSVWWLLVKDSAEDFARKIESLSFKEWMIEKENH